MKFYAILVAAFAAIVAAAPAADIEKRQETCSVCNNGGYTCWYASLSSDLDALKCD
jgi:hypothetical protein